MTEPFSRVARRTPRSRWRGPMLVSGAVAHAALFTGMWAKGLWNIQLVEAAENEVTIALAPSPPPVESGARRSSAPPPRLRAARGLHQPPRTPVIPDAPPAQGSPDALPGGPDDGGPEGVPESTAPPLPDPPPEPPRPPDPPPPPRPRAVAATVLEQQRIAGDKRILPDDATALRLARDGTSEVRGMVKLCLDTQGQVRSTDVLRSTGFADYDAKLEREMQTWRYRPYSVDGVAAPVCTVVTFIYRQR